MSPAPRVIRTTASNRFGDGVNRWSAANRRHRAPGRLRTLLPPVPCGRGLTDAGRDLADAPMREPGGERATPLARFLRPGGRLAQRAVESSRQATRKTSRSESSAAVCLSVTPPSQVRTASLVDRSDAANL